MSFAVHNAVQLDDAQVRDRFVVRAHELDELLAHLREPAPPRHALVIGQRGMGKSLLLRRVAVTVADDPDLAARWLPVLMPEEMYEVTSTGELWLAALDRLAQAEADADLAAQHAALLAEPDPSRLATLALQRLLGAARARGRKVLLLAENLDMLLDDQVAADDGWALRGALQTEPDLLLIGSAVSTFTRMEESGEAFYGFFHRVDLGPLEDDDVRALWSKVTGVELAGDRIVPIRILTGGNPRLISVLGRFSKRPDLSSLREDLELLIDEYTPYFKANIEVLPPVERKVFVTLADIWAPATAAEVAEKARMTSSQVSSLLGRLVRRGAVQAVDLGNGRQHYELTERLYNLYHLLRRSGGEGRVRALVDILIHLYGPEELERDVFPGIVRADMPELDVAVASAVHRFFDDANVLGNLPRRGLKSRLAVFESLLASQQTTLGHQHEDTLRCRLQVAYIRGSIGEVAVALRLSEALVSDTAKALGPGHRLTLQARLLWAGWLGESGDHRRSLALNRELVTDLTRLRGPTDPTTLAARHNEAINLGYLGDTQSALDLMHGVAADEAQVLVGNHRGKLLSRYWEAELARQAGRMEVALAIIEDVVARAEDMLAFDDQLLEASRQLRNLLAIDMASRSIDRLPREWREALKRRRQS